MMLHRTSIFDLATLEAMNEGCLVVLSRTGGNIEYNVCGNILFQDEDWMPAVLDNEGRASWGRKNMEAFVSHFSPDEFARRYERAHQLMAMAKGLRS